MGNKNYRAFTVSWNGQTNVLSSDIGVSIPFNPDSYQLEPDILSYKAIWDTGATCSVITKDVAKKLGLEPVSKTIVRGVGGEKIENVYLVNFYLPNKVMIPFVRITECDELGGNEFGVLIGMDIISIGDFAVTNVNGKTTMSYRYPSIKTIDYVKEAERDNAEKGKKASLLKKKELNKKRKRERQNKKKNRKMKR